MLNQFLGFCVCCHSLDCSDLFSVALCWGGCEHKGPVPVGDLPSQSHRSSCSCALCVLFHTGAGAHLGLLWVP